MNAVVKALREKLLADATLVAMLADPKAVWEDVAPQGSGHPFIVINLHTGPKEFTFEGLAFDKPLYLIKAVDKSSSAVKAGDIAARVQVVLTDAMLNVAGRQHCYLRPENVVSYSEVEGSNTYRHRGDLYRLFVA